MVSWGLMLTSTEIQSEICPLNVFPPQLPSIKKRYPQNEFHFPYISIACLFTKVKTACPHCALTINYICHTWFTCLFSVIRANVYFSLAPWAGEHPKNCEVTPEDPWGVEDHWQGNPSGRTGTLHFENSSSVHHIYVGHRLCDVRNSNAFRNWRMTLTLLYNSLLQHFFTITIFQHFSTMLFSKFLYKKQTKTLLTLLWKAFLQHSFATLLCNTLFQHISTFVCSTRFSNTSLQHPSPTLLSNTLPQHFFTTPFSKISLQHVCHTSLQWISPQQFEHNSSKTPRPKDYQTVQKDSNHFKKNLGLIIDYLQLYLISTMCKHVSTGQTIWGVAPNEPKLHMRKSLPLKQPTDRRLPGWTGWRMASR